MNHTQLKAVKVTALPVIPHNRTIEGDWASYQTSLDEFRDQYHEQNADEGHPTHERSRMFLTHSLLQCRVYLGPRIRSFRRDPTVLTAETVESMSLANQARREISAPYFVELAALYRRMTELESHTGR